MSELSVMKTYEAIYALIDIQELWRKTRPQHSLGPEEREELSNLLSAVRRALDKIEEDSL